MLNIKISHHFTKPGSKTTYLELAGSPRNVLRRSS
ncbi:hypothetical protein BVRB_2g034110 [Beta vulgaris subsp. vulgaris]|nr:hypothetical protein BVRB_2g034110 [Beta vulgaris subsp. vulgaris]